MPGARRKALADQGLRGLIGRSFEDELIGLGVEQQDRGGLGPEDRARDVDHGLQQRPVLVLGAEHAGCHRGTELICHVPPPTFVAVR